jgi:putative ABC transport system permease protein
MLTIALQTLRQRWTLFAGAFVALALGVGLIASTATVLIASTRPPRPPAHVQGRYAATTVVVRADQHVRVSNPNSTSAEPVAAPRTLPVGVASKLAGVPGAGQVVVDRSFYAQLATGSGLVTGGGEAAAGHGWSSAALTPYRLRAGRAPSGPGEVVAGTAVADRAGAGVGDEVRVLTADGPLRVRVVGLAAPPGPTPGGAALFFEDATAARLSGDPDRADAVGVVGAPGADAGALREAVRAALPDRSLQVSSGADADRADATPPRSALDDVPSLMAVTASIAGFVAVFVVASTFAFTVAQRRREVALLRLVGATPAQLRRMLLGEALALGAAASLAGCALGVPGARLLVSMLVGYGLAPAWFQAPPSGGALLLAFGLGLVVALLGVLLASRRIGKVHAVEALRDAATDRRVMTASRWVVGLAFAVGGVVMTALAPALGMEAATALSSMTAQVLVVGLAALAPLLVPPVVWLVGLLPARLTTASGLLAQQQARAALRRTASTAAPVMVAVAITGSVLTTLGTMSASTVAAVTERTTADLVVLPNGTPGLAASTVAAIRAADGVAAASPTVSTTLFSSEGGDLSLDTTHAEAVDPAAYASTQRRGVLAGSLAALRGDAVAVSSAHASTYGWQLGEQIDGRLADGTAARLRVVAVLDDALGAPEVLLPLDLVLPHEVTALADSVLVRLRDGTNPARVAAALRPELTIAGATVTPTDAWLAAGAADAQQANRFAIMVLLGMATAYTMIAIANTMVMAASQRRRDLAVLQLTGVTVAQILRALTWETAMVLAAGVVFGALAGAASVLGMWGALARLSDAARLVLPWGWLLAIVGAAAAIALLASLLPARLALRQPPVQLAGIRE